MKKRSSSSKIQILKIHLQKRAVSNSQIKAIPFKKKRMKLKRKSTEIAAKQT